MQHKNFSSGFTVTMATALSILAFNSGCASTSSPKDQEQKAEVALGAAVAAASVKETPQETQPAVEEFSQLQSSVYFLEDQIYGSKKLGTLGLLGELKSCKRKLASKQYGGTGELFWMESLDRVSDKESEYPTAESAGGSGNGSERQIRFLAYRTILEKRSVEFQSQINSCKTELQSRTNDPNQPSQVLVTEVVKGGYDKATVNTFICQFVKKDASLRDLMVELFARGWLVLSDFKMNQNLIASTLMDQRKTSRDHGFMFSGWKMAFDRGQVTVGELISGKVDAKLKAWSYPFVKDVPGGENCLSKDGVWSP